MPGSPKGKQKTRLNDPSGLYNMFNLHNYLTLGRFQGDDDAIVRLSFSCGKCIKKIIDRSGEEKIIQVRDRA